MNFSKIGNFVREIYGDGIIPLHRPVFSGNEKMYLADCIDSNFVSSVGQRVTDFERTVSDFIGIAHSVAVVNGTAGLQVALRVSGVAHNEEVITQAVTFVATCNAITHCGATPVFVDVDRDTMGMSPSSLREFLEEFAVKDGEVTRNRLTGRRIAACVPMHTFGHPCRIEELAEICEEYAIPLVEDAAESLGSYVGSKHTGTFGVAGVLSFNGNKLITTGGGGMIVTNEEKFALESKHLTTTAKKPHPYEFEHDEIGYNFRMPNLNAALGCAQMELLSNMLKVKRNVAQEYASFFESEGVDFKTERDGTTCNYWLNCLVLESKNERDEFLESMNAEGIMVRPIWKLMSDLKMFGSCQKDSLENSRWLVDRVVNIPSSVPDDVH